MANLGRAYPRLFERDMGYRDGSHRFAYLAKRLVCRLAGPQFMTWGWPTTDLVSDVGVCDYSAGVVRWRFTQPSPSPSTRYVEARWSLTHTTAWYLPYWWVQQSTTLTWYSDDAYPRLYPDTFPRVFGSLKRFSTGLYDPLIGITLQRHALWTDP